MAHSGKRANGPKPANNEADRNAGVKLSVLVVDDHELFRQGLMALVARIFPDARVTGAATAAEALAIAADPAAGLDLVLLDLKLPDEDGHGALGQLIAMLPDSPVAVVTASESAQDMATAYQTGAKGYIVKSATAEVMRNALQLIVSGETYIPSIAAAVLWSSEQRRPGGGSALTPRQHEVLTLMAQGLQNRAIAIELGMPEATVKVHVKGVLQKLGVNNRTHAVMTAVRLGMLSLGSGRPVSDNPE